MEKTWFVYSKYGMFVGYVRAKTKGLALFRAEQRFKLEPGFYVGHEKGS